MLRSSRAHAGDLTPDLLAKINARFAPFCRAPKYPQAAFDRAYAECKADPSWTTCVAENSHHDVMIDQPEWLADILMKHS